MTDKPPAAPAPPAHPALAEALRAIHEADHPPLPPAWLTDEAGAPVAVPVDLPCVACGYNLRALATDGRCPECGEPIPHSLRGDRLRFSDYRWLGRLARGARLGFWAVLVMLLVHVLVVLLRGHGLLVPMVALGYGLGVAGAWLVARPEPGRPVEPFTLTGRGVARVALWPALTLAVVTRLGEALVVPWSVGYTFWMHCLFVERLLALVATALVLGQYRRLADRVPDARLGRHTRMLAGGFSALAALMTISWVLGTLAPLLSSGGPSPLSGLGILVPACLGAPLVILLSAWLLWALGRARHVFAEQARSAWTDQVYSRPER